VQGEERKSTTLFWAKIFSCCVSSLIMKHFFYGHVSKPCVTEIMTKNVPRVYIHNSAGCYYCTEFNFLLSNLILPQCVVSVFLICVNKFQSSRTMLK